MNIRQSLIFFVLFCSQVQALETVTIPNAVCGNGSPYSVFIEQKNDEKLMVEFMGGGACWDFESCFILPHTWILPIPNLGNLSIFTNNNSELNFLKDHSKIYFPYCTGDIHVGKHVAIYGVGTKVYHNGYNNLTLALDYLKSQKKIKFNKVNDLVVWGASAGALATMLHSKSIEKYVSRGAHKVMILDSPGLHWGKSFWKKFSNKSIRDFDEAFKKVNVKLDFTNGFIAKDIVPLFNTYSDWKIGFILATKDFVMSSIFGEITAQEQEDLILSKNGLPKLAENYSNVEVWVKDTRMHTFLLFSKSAQMESFDNQSAIDFSYMIYNKK